jgi:CRISPR-associated protein (TIGR02584 family)
MEPGSYPRRILVCVTGLSPQTITETLYALAVRQQSVFVPTEIQLITTAEGASRAELTLLDPDQGYLHRLCADYGLDATAIRFDAGTIHVIPSQNGAPLADIRTLTDNEAAADTIIAVVRELTHDPNSAVHASIAGGRKSMGFFLGYALSLFGRPQDRLSHVLVPTAFESHPEFFYPPPKPRVLFTRDNRPVRTDEADITLADIPFVRLRDGLPESLLGGRASFSETVRQAQRSLGPAELVLDSKTRRVRCAGITLALRPVEFAFLAWFAQRALAGIPGICRTAVSLAETAEFLAEYRSLTDQLSGEYERVERALRNGMDYAYFDQRKSLLHKHLNKALGKSAAKPYLIASDNCRPQSCYALTLKPQQIRFADLDMEGEST